MGEQLPDAAPHVLLAVADSPASLARPTLALRIGALLRDRETRRLISFLFAGGVSAVVTITVTSLLEGPAHQAFFYAAVCGTEVGILVNFAVNDVVSFRDLAGHERSLPVRLGRFHLTCALGQSLILLSSLLLHDIGHWQTVFAQGVPIILVTVVNFMMHRFWTYRGQRA